MKKIFVSILALTLTVGSFAQAVKSDKKFDRKEQGERKKHAFDDKMNFTDAQKAQMKTINENFRSKMQSLKQDKSLSEDAQKQKREALVKEHRSQVQSILTPGQKKQWEESKKQHAVKGTRGKWHGDKGDNKLAQGEKRGDRSQRFEKMKEDLNLTADQSARFKTVNESFRTNIQSIRNNDALSAEQKKEQMKNLQKKHKEEIDAILTADQKAQMKNSMKNRQRSVRR